MIAQLKYNSHLSTSEQCEHLRLNNGPYGVIIPYDSAQNVCQARPYKDGKTTDRFSTIQQESEWEYEQKQGHYKIPGTYPSFTEPIFGFPIWFRVMMYCLIPLVMIYFILPLCALRLQRYLTNSMTDDLIEEIFLWRTTLSIIFVIGFALSSYWYDYFYSQRLTKITHRSSSHLTSRTLPEDQARTTPITCSTAEDADVGDDQFYRILHTSDDMNTAEASNADLLASQLKEWSQIPTAVSTAYEDDRQGDDENIAFGQPLLRRESQVAAIMEDVDELKSRVTQVELEDLDRDKLYTRLVAGCIEISDLLHHVLERGEVLAEKCGDAQQATRLKSENSQLKDQIQAAKARIISMEEAFKLRDKAYNELDAENVLALRKATYTKSLLDEELKVRLEAEQMARDVLIDMSEMRRQARRNQNATKAEIEDYKTKILQMKDTLQCCYDTMGKDGQKVSELIGRSEFFVELVDKYTRKYGPLEGKDSGLAHGSLVLAASDEV